MVESTPGCGVVTYVTEPTVLFVSLQRADFHKCVCVLEFTGRLEKHTIV